VDVVGYGVNDAQAQTGIAVKRHARLGVDQISRNEMVAGRAGKSTCHGDSGGPWFATVHGQRRMVALTSGGSDDCSGAGYATRVDRVASFLQPFIDADLAGTLVQDADKLGIVALN
jgi:secreted trypsin-like serine protease